MLLDILGIVATLSVGPIGWLLRGRRYKRTLNRRRSRFESIFGRDALLGSDFYAVQTHFTLEATDQDGNPRKHIYRKSKPRERIATKGIATFSIEHPVSGGGARALNYVSAVIQAESGEPVRISTDYDLDTELDITFVSFGGPLSNYKTQDANDDEANNLVYFDEPDKGFIDLRTDHTIVEPEPHSKRRFDYGLILKLQPTDHRERTWLVCAGYDEWGTSGAAWYLAKNWENIYKRAEKEPFAIVVKVELEKDKSAQVIWDRYLHEEESN